MLSRIEFYEISKQSFLAEIPFRIELKYLILQTKPSHHTNGIGSSIKNYDSAIVYSRTSSATTGASSSGVEECAQ